MHVWKQAQAGSMKIREEAHLALAQGKLKGLVAVQARVELAPVLVEGARVVHRQLVALLGLDVAVLGAGLDADALYLIRWEGREGMVSGETLQGTHSFAPQHISSPSHRH